MNDLNLGKTISYALRHNPNKYHLNPDNEGYVPIDDLIDGLKSVEGVTISIDDIHRIMDNSNKKRYEIVGNFIRATYGHSKVHVDKEKVEPPNTLYHGTTHRAYKSIKTEGLKPMDRQFVHLSEDIETAKQVGKRRESNPVILKIDSGQAYKDGIAFYRGNDITWLSDSIPIKYIKQI